jgi:methylated-DNA-[protein]-cysteine S-methyltransferase
MPNPTTFGPLCDEGFEQAIRQLREYFDGQRRQFGVPVAARGDAFQHRVWNLVQQIPYGHTVTYGDLAGRLGGDFTAQQVGAAMGRNPLCIFIPCHRVVGRTGKLTGYAGGVGRKGYLLDLEQSNFARTLSDEKGRSHNTCRHDEEGKRATGDKRGSALAVRLCIATHRLAADSSRRSEPLASAALHLASHE